MGSLMEHGMALWRRHWQCLVLVCLVAAVVPGLVAALAGVAPGLVQMGWQEALVLLLPVQAAGQTRDLEGILTNPGGWVAFLIYMVLYLLTSAGSLGVLRPIVHEGRRPRAADYVDGIRRYGGRLFVVRVLCGLVLAVSGIAAGLVYVLAEALLAGWLVPLAAVVVFLAGVSAILYADYALVVEPSGAATEAVGDSVGVLTERWREAAAAAFMFVLISAAGEAVGWLLARIVGGAAGLLLSILPVALARSVVLAYLLVRYIENVHRGIYGRMGRFATDDLKAG